MGRWGARPTPRFVCGANRRLAIRDGVAFDRSAAIASIFAWADFEDGGGSPAAQRKARQCFFLYEADAPELKTSYHLPFARVTDGTPTAIGNGVRNAASRLEQMDGVPSDAHDAARAAIDAYLERFKAEGENDAPVQETRFGFLAPLSDVRIAGADDPLMAKVHEHAFDTSSLADNGVLLFRAVISTSQPDAYMTVMDKSSLQNFAAHAEEGRSVLYGHDTYQIVGRSFAGKATLGGTNPRTESWAYVPLGLNMAGVSTDEVARGLRTGLLRDTSVGFFGGTYRCTICGLSLWDRNCPHIPGLPYAREGADEEETAYARVIGANLAEYSLVFDGATPGATVLGLKAQREVDAGRLAPLQARLLEAQYRVRLPGARQVWALKEREPALDDEDDEGDADADADEEERAMPKFEHKGVVRLDTARLSAEQRAALGELAGLFEPLPGEADPLTTVPHDALRALFTEFGQTLGADPVASVRAVLEGYRTRGEEIERLKPQAADGEQYRKDLVQETLGEGVRALGANFNRERYEAVLGRATLEEVKQFRDDWKVQGDAVLAGGRQTIEVDEKAQRNGQRPRVRVGR